MTQRTRGIAARLPGKHEKPEVRSGAVGASEKTGVQTRDFEALYRDHAIHVYRYLRSRVPSDDDATELTAVTFERAPGAHVRFEPTGGGERAWLIRIARNAAIDHLRDQGRTVSGAPLLMVPSADPTPEESVIREERYAELRSHVGALPEPQREALHLRYAGGLTAWEIGTVLDKSEAATQKLITRALASLREAIGHER